MSGMTQSLASWSRLASWQSAFLSGLLLFSSFFSCLFLSGPAEGREHAPSRQESLELMSGDDPGSVASYIDIYQGAEAADIEAIFAGEAAAGRADELYRRNTGSFVNPGVTKGNVWLRLKLKNTGAKDGRWIFSFNRVLLNNVGLYLVRDGAVERLLDAEPGSPGSMEASYKKYRTLAGPIVLSPGEEALLYMRYRGANWSGLSPIMETEDSFRRNIARNLGVFLVLLGGTTTLIVFGSVSFLFLGRQVVLFYALAQTALFAFYAHFSGITTVYLWPHMAQNFRIFAPVAMVVFILSITQFARGFFETKKLLPRIDKLLLGCIGLCLISLVFLPFDYLVPAFDRRIPLFGVYFVSAACWAILPALAVYATIKWHRDFWPMIVAWGLTGFFILSLQLIWLGVISEMPFEQNAYGFVVYLEALFLALAIALRIRVLRAETLAAEKRSSESLRLQLAETERARKLAEEREWALQDLAEKGRLLLTTGHDTRQMISALRNYSAGLRSASQDDKVRLAGHRIDEIADHLNEVLSTAVEGSRSGGMTDNTLALDTITPSKIFDPLHLIHSAAAREKNIELRTRVADRSLVTDRVLVGRILGNLFSNAIKATEDGKILLAFRVSKQAYRFQVWDTGKGIEKDALATLLDSKTGSLQLDGKVEGLGTGLTIVKALAQRLGGHIKARSQPGRGSMFELVLPVRRFQHEAVTAKIILADDDETLAPAFERLTTETGITLHRVASVDEIESHVREDSGAPLLIFVDEHFSGSQKGADWARDFSSRSSREVIILMTFDRSVEARTRLTEASSLLVYKPLSGDAIKAALDFVLDKHRSP